MDPSRWEQIQAVFHQVADQPADAQEALLDALCNGDDDLRTQVGHLLAADARGGSLLDASPAEIAGRLFDRASDTPADLWFGPYRVIRPIGEGGMGVVYLAERDDIGQRAAIKLLRDAWVSPSARDRFVREAQTLAQLTHPSIARILDADTLDDGTPWFAMEYVDGVAVTDYCDTHHCTLDRRLRILHDICEAVHYAHRKLTLHLDLKPSNVLVTEDGDVKLLDFGIARHLAQDGGAVPGTASAHRLLSLNYASPEQIAGEPLDVQADVYALGVLLYELIAGAVPIDLTNVTAARLAQALQEEPRRPSLRARSVGGMSRTRWRELDALGMKALSRDKAIRYLSVDRLMADVDRFLADEPLEASAGRLRYYRARKFLWRHRRLVAAAAAVVLTITALVTFFNVRLIAARDQAMASEARTQRVFRLMLNLFEGDDSAAGPAEGLRVVTLLDRGVRDAESLRDEPELQAELNFTLGGLYHKLGHLERGEPLLRSALAAQESLFAPDDPETLRPRLALAQLLLDRSKTEEARMLIDRSLAVARQHYAGNGVEVATASAALGKLLVTEGDYDQGIPLLERSVEVLSQGRHPVELSEALGDLANGVYYTGQIERAEALNQRALVLDREIFGERHPNVGVDLYNLGSIALDHADYGESERLYRQALAINEEWYGPAHQKTASNLLMIGRALVYQGRLGEAAQYYDRAAGPTKAAFGEHSVRYASVLSLMGDLARERRQLEEADRCFRHAGEIFKDTIGDDHEFYLHQLSNLASVNLLRGRYDLAEPVLRQAAEHLTKAVPDQRYTGVARVRLGTALLGLRRYDDARQEAERGLQILQATLNPASVEVQDARALLIEIYTGLDEPQKARDVRDAFVRYGGKQP